MFVAAAIALHQIVNDLDTKVHNTNEDMHLIREDLSLAKTEMHKLEKEMDRYLPVMKKVENSVYISIKLNGETRTMINQMNETFQTLVNIR